MGGYVGLAICFLGALLQATVLSSLPVFGVHADLVLIAVVAWASLHGVRDALLWAVIGGLALDLFSAGPFGASVVAMIGASLVAAGIGYRVRGAHGSARILALPTGVGAFYLLSMLVFGVTGRSVDVLGTLANVVGPTIVLSTLIGPVALVLLSWLAAAIEPEWTAA